jgi:hypothetical protein
MVTLCRDSLALGLRRSQLYGQRPPSRFQEPRYSSRCRRRASGPLSLTKALETVTESESAIQVSLSIRVLRLASRAAAASESSRRRASGGNSTVTAAGETRRLRRSRRREEPGAHWQAERPSMPA